MAGGIEDPSVPSTLSLFLPLSRSLFTLYQSARPLVIISKVDCLQQIFSAGLQKHVTWLYRVRVWIMVK